MSLALLGIWDEGWTFKLCGSLVPRRQRGLFVDT